MFRMQRTMLEQTQKAVETNLHFQRSAVHAMVGSMDSTKSVQKSGLNLSKRAVESYLDAVSEATPNDRAVEEFRSVVEEQYAAADELHDDAWEAFSDGVEETVSSYDDLNESQIELVDEMFQTLVEAQMDAQTATEDAMAQAEQVAESAAESAAEVAEDTADQI